MNNSPAPTAPEPPHSADTEAAALGSALISAPAAQQVTELLTEADFHLPRHKLIFAALYDALEWGLDVNTLTVPEQLRAKGQLEAAGGLDYVLGLTDATPTAKHIDSYIKLLLEQTELREAHYRTQKIAALYSAPDLPDAEKHARNADILEQGQDRRKAEIIAAPEWMEATLAAYGPGAEGKDQNWIRTGFVQLDEMVEFACGDFIIVAGRPSMGKTQVALELLRGVTLRSQPALMFSLDMRKEIVGARLQSAQTAIADVSQGVPLSLLINHAKEHVPAGMSGFQIEQIEFATEALCGMPLYVNDSTDLTVRQIEALTKQAMRKHGVTTIIVDHIGKIDHGKAENRNIQVGNTSKALRSLGRRLGVLVIALAQLSRANEKRGKEGYRPMLSDLRESGDIEQEADTVLLLHRPQYYERMNAGQTDDGEGGMEVNVAKSRNGRVGVVRMRTSLKVGRIWEDVAFAPLPEAPPPGRGDRWDDDDN